MVGHHRYRTEDLNEERVRWCDHTSAFKALPACIVEGDVKATHVNTGWLNPDGARCNYYKNHTDPALQTDVEKPG